MPAAKNDPPTATEVFDAIRHTMFTIVVVGFSSRQPATLNLRRTSRSVSRASKKCCHRPLPTQHVRRLDKKLPFCDSLLSLPLFKTDYCCCCCCSPAKTKSLQYLLLCRGVLAQAGDALVDVHPKFGLTENAKTGNGTNMGGRQYMLRRDQLYSSRIDPLIR